VDGNRNELAVAFCSSREAFIEAVVGEYLQQNTLDAEDKGHVAMVLLEVEATKVGDGE
jgi:hypothetical protein